MLNDILQLIKSRAPCVAGLVKAYSNDINIKAYNNDINIQETYYMVELTQYSKEKIYILKIKSQPGYHCRMRIINLSNDTVESITFVADECEELIYALEDQFGLSIMSELL